MSLAFMRRSFRVPVSGTNRGHSAKPLILRGTAPTATFWTRRPSCSARRAPRWSSRRGIAQQLEDRRERKAAALQKSHLARFFALIGRRRAEFPRPQCDHRVVIVDFAAGDGLGHDI